MNRNRLLCGVIMMVVPAACETPPVLALDVSSARPGIVEVRAVAPRGTNLDTVTLYRSTVNLSTRAALDLRADPITKIVIPSRGERFAWLDTTVADNAVYYYFGRARDSSGGEFVSSIVRVSTPDVMLPDPAGNTVSFFIDKIRYVLEVRAGGQIIKRYPINLGGVPDRRKLHYDCLSTPEGRYRIAFVNHNSSFHKGLLINYPNAEDRKRYDAARRAGLIAKVDGVDAHIGGSITIHGGGIGHNWTWGCIAMRNDDIDEIFALPGLAAGLRVDIAGREVPRESFGH